ncbi:hypothetical protein [Streptomyces milbemycinicus]|uniref:hypothetical protein n=1 Tax=Streptomyces milbemycinicus TaxID=476552 RepID=UPI0033EC9591
MRRLLPDAAVVTERGELTATPLYPEEEAVVTAAMETRRREFATGRRCARSALAGLGYPVGAGNSVTWSDLLVRICQTSGAASRSPL